MPRIILPLLSVPLLLSALAACEQDINRYAAPPPPKVTVARPLQKDVIDYLEFTGNTAAVATVEVRARVQGYLESMHFEPGRYVNQGDLLFVIDPKPFEARLAAAKAERASAEARLMGAESDYQRKKIAGNRGAVTEADVIAALAERNAAQAAVEAAKANITQAELDLGYTQVTAPLSGVISRNLVDVGNLVGNGEATLLTTIRTHDPIYAYFNLNERDLLKLLAEKRAEMEQRGGDYQGVVPLYLGLANETGFPHEGELDFAESSVDPGTGTIELRGVFPNPKRPPALLPGLFARIRAPVAKREGALLVSERAIGADQSGDYLLVANSDNVIEKRPITKGQLIDGLRVIDEGISAEDWVVISGLLRARPGAAVDPQRSDMTALAESANLGQADAAESLASP